MKGDRERYLAAGMDGYVSKPIQSHELFEAIEEAMAVRAENARLHEQSTRSNKVLR
jgi:CheY-like chemotaxis protein